MGCHLRVQRMVGGRSPPDDYGALRCWRRRRTEAPRRLTRQPPKSRARPNSALSLGHISWSRGVGGAAASGSDWRLREQSKAEAIDARSLCDFARLIRPQPKPPKDEATRQLANLLGRRRQLVNIRIQELQRQHTANTVTLIACLHGRSLRRARSFGEQFGA
jgi:hypothetical protein